MCWNDAWDLTSGLLRDPTSHSFAAIADWAYPPSAPELAGHTLFERWMNANRPKHGVPQRLPRPWEEKQAKTAPGAVTREQAARRRRLAERLGIQ